MFIDIKKTTLYIRNRVECGPVVSQGSLSLYHREMKHGNIGSPF